MANPAPLDPKPEANQGHVWTVWADWDLVVKVGVGFLAAITLVVWIQFSSEGDNQRMSFAVALTTLHDVRLETPLTQRQARLLKTGQDYSWRAILQVKGDSLAQRQIWQAHVRHEGDAFVLVDTQLTPFRADLADSLDLREFPLQNREPSGTPK